MIGKRTSNICTSDQRREGGEGGREREGGGRGREEEREGTTESLPVACDMVSDCVVMSLKINEICACLY